MNYRHAFHAGNFADVVKHVAMVCLLRRLTEKPKPLTYVETHAGRGLYDLQGGAARRSGEAAQGILRVVDGPIDSGSLGDYLEIVRGMNPAGPVGIYPGSPVIAAAVLRSYDRAVLCERHPEEARALAEHFRDDPRISVQRRDGYAALAAILPPTPRRGCVFIDPPYEAADDMDCAVSALNQGLERWPTGIFVLWYPIKERRDAVALRRRLQDVGEEAVTLEFCVTPDDSPARLNGCGLAVIRPPWRFRPVFETLRDQLAEALCGGRPARADVICLGNGDGKPGVVHERRSPERRRGRSVV